MLAYRYLTGIDDAAFCHRVTGTLKSGWELYGEPSLTYDSARGAVICGQAIVKNNESTTCSESLNLPVL
ncbi:DUF1737 domain-containing protein [Pseudomonadota bacterium 24LQ007]|uniref:DUF1737 domain-containing protein n=1 Tax=uncultured Sulfitobacter sp. TaxID=191468 RepID=UPI0032B17A46